MKALLFSALLCGLCSTQLFAQSDGQPRGAYDVPYTRYESEDATRGGGAILRSSPAFVQTDVASEASNQKYVALPTNGSSVSFTVSKPGAGVDLRFTMPDAPSGGGVTGALNLYVNGQNVKTISLSSYWSWQYFASGSGDPTNTPGGRAFMRFDEVHFKLANRLNAGDVVKIQKDNGDAYEYGVDFIEVEDVPAAVAKPAGYVSVTDYGAIANDGKDDLMAFNNCLAAAKSASTGMYIPEGSFTLASTWRPAGTVLGIKGAGIWYSNLNFPTNAYFSGGILAALSNTEVSGLYLSTANNARQENGQARIYKCFMGAYGTGTRIHDIWEEHFECGFWIGDYDTQPAVVTSNLLVSHNRIRNNYADGCNFAQGTNNSTVEFCSVRNNGDDGVASWSSTDAGVTTVCTNLEFKNNTIENNWRAGGIGVFGGANHKIHHNTVKDGIGGSGIRFTTEFPGKYFETNTNMQVYEMTITNCGTSTDLFNQERGAIDMYAANAPIKNITFSYVDILNAQRNGVQFGPSNTIDNITYNSLTINGTGRDNETKSVYAPAYDGYAIFCFAGTGTSTFNNLVLSNIATNPPTYKAQSGYNLIINAAAPVAVTGVSVAPASATLAVGATQQLTATVAPSNATNKTVTWSTSNAAVATVSTTGLVTAAGGGTATITATTQDGSKTATSAIMVSGGPAPGTLTANKTASVITVNGQLTETGWALNQTVGKTTTGTPNNTVTFGVLWDNTNLYIGAKVLDANLFADSPDAWNDDAIEVYIDANNNKLTSYDGADNQIIKGYNKSTVFTKVAISGLQHAWAAISGGYSVEMAIPWAQLGISAPAAGTTIGFDLGYDDDDNGADRDGQAVWNGTLNNYASTAGFGSLTLSNTAARAASTLASAANLAAPTLAYWPSPVAQTLNITTDGAATQVAVCDMLGKVLYRDSAITGKTALTLDLSGLATGVYYVKLQGGLQPSGFRIVKQ